MITRRNLFRGLLGGTLAGLSLGGYGFWVEPALRLVVRHWQVMRGDWTAPPLRIAALSDLHLGEPWVGPDRVRRIVARTNALSPDLIVLLGDYALGNRYITREVPTAEVAPILAGLRAPLGVFAILGNHDWFHGGPAIHAAALQDVGIPVLSNRAVRLPDFWLAGIEDQLAIHTERGWFGLDDLLGTLAQITDDAPVIVLAHEPDIFPQVPPRVALTLSGHTHGGQVRILGWSPVVPSAHGGRYAYGHVREGGRDLIVSGGIGTSILPVRLGVPPEITLIDVAGTAAAAPA